MATRKKLTINVMAPLLVSEPSDPPSSIHTWSAFKEELKIMRDLGVDAIATDLWWRLLEPEEGKFQWWYPEKLFEAITGEGMLWAPGLPFHRCGGNVNDGDINIPLPDWIWRKLPEEHAANFVSEQNNRNYDYVAFWATPIVLSNYRQVFEEFQRHFAGQAHHIAEITVGAGPTGEARFNSYPYDWESNYPNRGAWQCYSPAAINAFAKKMLEKYEGSQAAIERAWKEHYTADVLVSSATGGHFTVKGKAILPPTNPKEFLASQSHLNSQYGRDFCDWYADTLLEHVQMVLGTAIRVFADNDAPFAGIDIGAKIPGIHWRLGVCKAGTRIPGDRLAELTAGLIRTSGNDWEDDEHGNQLGHGYRPLLSLFGKLNSASTNSRVVLHFTCLDIEEGDGGTWSQSMAQTLVRWIGEEAQRQGVPLKGENALSWNLYQRRSWRLMRAALKLRPEGLRSHGLYDGLTLLRMWNIATNDTARKELERTVRLAQFYNQQ